MPISYTTVIATRNRPDALALSLPLQINQSLPPKAIFVIDSSDNPATNQVLVADLSKQTNIPITHIVAPSGTSRQRNIGLELVKTDVVFFPDDDSLPYPDDLRFMMRIYERDQGGIIGGVCAAEALTPLFGVLDIEPSYKMTLSDRVRTLIAPWRYAFEKRFIPNPFTLVGQELYRRLPAAPDWLDEENAVTVDWMTGFCMSFRTDVIRQIMFNEHLGRYALFEDADACFGVLQKHLLIGAQNATIYHHKSPERRSNGRVLGAMQILNRAYAIARSGVLCADKSSPQTIKRISKGERRFAYYKLLQYGASAVLSSFGRERFLGAWAAIRIRKQLLECSPSLCDTLYIKLRARLLFNDD